MTTSEGGSQREVIRKARGNFAAMAATYCLGVFNDNFFKQAAMIIAVVSGKDKLQGYAAVVFTLPFILFAAPAGWMADRFSKRNVVIGSKALELAAMIFGAAGIVLVNWYLVFVMLALMALQSTIFSPSLNGSIPELYPADYVTRANGYLKMFSIGGILAGIATAGIVLDMQGAGAFGASRGQVGVAIVVIGVALFGLAVSLGVPRRRAAAPESKFPWSGPIDTARTWWDIRKDRLLRTVIMCNVYFWFLGLLQYLILNPMGLKQFGYSKSLTSYLIAAQMVGIAIGGLISGWLSQGKRWTKVLAPSAAVLGACMAAVGGTPHIAEGARLYVLFGLLGAAGIAGGIFVIPLESFIQVRPSAERKGAVISAANAASFTGMLLAGFVSNGLNAVLKPTTSYALAGCATILVAVAIMFTFRGGPKE